MFYLKRHTNLSFILSFPAFFISLFFFFSCTHFESSQASDRPMEAQAKNRNEKKSFGSLRTGLTLYKEGKLNEARDQLEKLNYKEDGFLPSILEIQKINYIEQDWDRFFGLASYYRKRLLYSEAVSVENFKQEMLALEVLALIRHCRLSEALKIVKWSLKLAKRIGRDSSKIRKTLYFFRLKAHIGEKKAQKIDWEKQINLWSINPENIKWLSNPKHVRMKVNNKC